MANGGGRGEGLDVRRQEGEGEIVENELDCSIRSSLRRLPVKYIYIYIFIYMLTMIQLFTLPPLAKYNHLNMVIWDLRISS